MSIFKRGTVYWFHFLFNGEHIQRSTKQGNPRVARQMEAAHRTVLAKGEVGIVDRQPAPTLAKFIEDRFEPWARATFETASPKTWTGWYRTQLANINSYAPLTKRKLGTITSEHVADYAAFLQMKEWQPSSVNSSLRVLRRVLKLAVEWGTADNAPKIKLLRGEHHREHVVSREEEARYLAAANELLADIVTVLSDSGMRPEENARLRWESIRWHNGQQGTLQVTHGKTAAARRMLPISARVRTILEKRWQRASQPVEGWVWSSETKSGHIEPSTLKKQHRNAIRDSKVRPFVMYSLRHTFLTRLGEAGCDAWTLARIAGHSSISMSARYVHPSSDNVARAFELLDRNATVEYDAVRQHR
ncbi:MAG: tyrosine-type recombinase/integrase [Janthinobacterium lividum]